MNTPYKKLCEFWGYCRKCKYKYTDQEALPCDDCLSVPARKYTHEPSEYEYDKAMEDESNRQEMGTQTVH